MSGHQGPVHPDFGFMTDDEVYVRLGPGEEVYIPEWASAGSSIPEGVSTRRTGGASAVSSKPEGVSTEPPDLRQALLAVRTDDDPAVAAGATAHTPRARVTPRACARAKQRVARLPHHTVRATSSVELFAKAEAAKFRARFTKAATKKRLLQGKCRKCRGIYTPQELGQGPQYRKKHYADARAKCLQQVLLRAPRLPLLRAVQGRCLSTHPQLSEGTRFDMGNVEKKDDQFAEAVTNGLNWCVLESHVLREYPQMRIIQKLLCGTVCPQCDDGFCGEPEDHPDGLHLCDNPACRYAKEHF